MLPVRSLYTVGMQKKRIVTLCGRAVPKCAQYSKLIKNEKSSDKAVHDVDLLVPVSTVHQ